MADQVMSVVWVGPGTGQTITRIRTAAGAGTILADLISISNGDKFNTWEGDLVVNASPVVTSAEYPALTQVANLLFLCADGTTAQLKLPAPQVGIMLADGVTVDATAITTLIADCVGALQGPSGSLAVSFQAGRMNFK